MGFINIQSVLIYDSTNNIHHFYLEDTNISYVKADVTTKKVQSKVLERNVKEFDAFIDEKDMIILMGITYDQKLVYFKISNDKIISSVISDKLNPELNDIHIFGDGEYINVMYSIPVEDIDNSRRILQSRYNGDDWDNNEVSEFTQGDSMQNEMKIIIEEDGKYLGFVEYEDKKSCLSVRGHDGVSWSKDILKIQKDEEIYWYDFNIYKNFIEIVYTNRIDGQFVIRYELYDIGNRKLIEKHDLSSFSNCMHPVFVSYKGVQWVVWIEMDGIFSCRLLNDRKVIEGPYKWKNSKKSNFMKCRFSYNNRMIERELGLKCNCVYALFPEYSLLGIGNLKGNAEYVSIRKKKDKIGEDKMEHKKEEIIKDGRVESKKVVEEEGISIQDKINYLEKRIDNIENYLKRRSRNSLFGKNKQK